MYRRLRRGSFASGWASGRLSGRRNPRMISCSPCSNRASTPPRSPPGLIASTGHLRQACYLPTPHRPLCKLGRHCPRSSPHPCKSRTSCPASVIPPDSTMGMHAVGYRPPPRSSIRPPSADTRRPRCRTPWPRTTSSSSSAGSRSSPVNPSTSPPMKCTSPSFSACQCLPPGWPSSSDPTHFLRSSRVLRHRTAAGSSGFPSPHSRTLETDLPSPRTCRAEMCSRSQERSCLRSCRRLPGRSCGSTCLP